MKQSDMFDDNGYLYPKYAIAKTTWSYCWRCGKKIAINHTIEVETGVHVMCTNVYEFEHYEPYAIKLHIGKE